MNSSMLDWFATQARRVFGSRASRPLVWDNEQRRYVTPQQEAVDEYGDYSGGRVGISSSGGFIVTHSGLPSEDRSRRAGPRIAEGADDGMFGTK